MRIEAEQEVDGRWAADILEVPGVLAYGVGREEAILKVQVLALRVLADRLEAGEPVPDLALLFEEPTGPLPAEG